MVCCDNATAVMNVRGALLPGLLPRRLVVAALALSVDAGLKQALFQFPGIHAVGTSRTNDPKLGFMGVGRQPSPGGFPGFFWGRTFQVLDSYSSIQPLEHHST